MTAYYSKLTVKKHNDGRYWLEDKKGVYDGPFQIKSEAQAIANRLNAEARNA